MTSDTVRSSIVLKVGKKTPDQPKQIMNLYLNKRTADTIRSVARLKAITQGELVDAAVMHYLRSLKEARDGGGGRP